MYRLEERKVQAQPEEMDLLPLKTDTILDVAADIGTRTEFVF